MDVTLGKLPAREKGFATNAGVEATTGVWRR
jgi:hypothetical protein